ncbi:MAG: hypothetical protein COA58_02955 [Bacteroidetes bacterium]|nr:MAG: hypothetical protein COA58_02955 [Bacteroidota bacterium]
MLVKLTIRNSTDTENIYISPTEIYLVKKSTIKDSDETTVYLKSGKYPFITAIEPLADVVALINAAYY